MKIVLELTPLQAATAAALRLQHAPGSTTAQWLSDVLGTALNDVIDALQAELNSAPTPAPAKKKRKVKK